MLTVPRQKIRHKVLAIATEAAENQLHRLLAHVLAAINQQISYAPENSAEYLLHKAAGQEEDDQKAATAARRRIEHGGPTDPAHQLPPEVIGRLLRGLPFINGKIEVNRTGGKKGKRILGATEILVPLDRVAAYGPIDLLTMKLVSDGAKAENIQAIKHADENKYSITNGSTTVFLGRILGLPALPMWVGFPRKMVQEENSHEGAATREELELFARNLTREHSYDVSDQDEPLAELARELDKETFLESLKNGQAKEEQEAEAHAVRSALTRSALWIKARNAGKNAGLSDEEAEQFAESWPDLRTLEREALEAQRDSNQISERWTQLKARAQTARELSRAYQEEDGRTGQGEPRDLVSFWEAANKGKGNQLLGFTPGMSVRVQDANGQWQDALVTDANGYSVKVERTDGTERRITDPKRIIPVDQLGILDDSTVTKTMNLEFPKWKVTIPNGSNSHRIEQVLEDSTAEMNDTPLRVNQQTWEQNQARLEGEAEQATRELRQAIGDVNFRPGANADVAKLLFEKMSLPPQRVSEKTGVPSVDEETMTILARMGHEEPKMILRARKALVKLSQLNAWEPYAKAGVVQSNFDQFGQPHGRYTSDQPNLFSRIEEIRETVEPDPGYVLLSNDLGQAEYVTWASLSKDEVLGEAFKNRQDFHQSMWDALLRAQPDLDIPGEDGRAKGKTANYALLYLMQAWTLAKKLGIDVGEAQKVMDTFRTTAPVAYQYQQDYIENAAKTGQASTRFGRTRLIPEIKGARGPKLHQAQKTLWHHHNGGTAAELLKIKQAKIHARIKREGLRSRLAIQFYDELIHLVPEDELEAMKALTQEEFDRKIPGFLPFNITQKAGPNWLSVSK